MVPTKKIVQKPAAAATIMEEGARLLEASKRWRQEIRMAANDDTSSVEGGHGDHG